MRRAFSLVEMLVVIAIIAILGVTIVPALLGGSHVSDLNNATQQIAASARQAQTQSASELQGTTWGVHFSNTTNTAPFYAVYSGASYASGTVQSYNRLPPTVAFVTSSVPVGTTEDVQFNAISGNANTSATIQLYVVSQPSLSSTVTIGTTGQIAFVTPTTPVSVVYNPLISSWGTATSLLGPIWTGAAVVSNGYIYMTGGNNNPFPVATVSFVPINSNGTLGAWTATANLPTNLEGHAAVANNGYIYVLGGEVTNGGAAVSNVYYAQISATSSIGNWSSTTALMTGLMEEGAVVNNSYMYTVGGEDPNGSITSTVNYVSINPNGTLGSWVGTTPMPSAYLGGSAVVYNNYLYVLAENSTTVLYAPINSNGTLGSWSATTPMPAPLSTTEAVVNSGYIYTAGGQASGATSTVYYVQINSNGTIGNWSSTTALPSTVFGQSDVANNGYMYVIGGNAGLVTAAVHYAQL